MKLPAHSLVNVIIEVSLYFLLMLQSPVFIIIIFLIIFLYVIHLYFTRLFYSIVVANLISAAVRAEFNWPKWRVEIEFCTVIIPLLLLRVDKDVADALWSLSSPHISFITSLFFSQPLHGWAFLVLLSLGFLQVMSQVCRRANVEQTCWFWCCPRTFLLAYDVKVHQMQCHCFCQEVLNNIYIIVMINVVDIYTE